MLTGSVILIERAFRETECTSRRQEQKAETECKDQYRQSEGMSGMDRDFLLVQKMRMGDEKAIEIFI